MRTLIKIILLIGFLILSGTLIGQNDDFSTIYFYRSSKFIGGGCVAKVFLNKTPIGSLKNKSKIKYRVYSEGKLTIDVTSSCKFSSTAVMNIENGKEYYVGIEFSM